MLKVKDNEHLFNQLNINVNDIYKKYDPDKTYVNFQVWLIGYSNDSEELLQEFDLPENAKDFARDYCFKLSEHPDMKRSSQIMLVVETTVGEYEYGELSDEGDENYGNIYEECVYNKSETLRYLEYTIYFKDTKGHGDVTSAEVLDTDNWNIELINLILSWKEEMRIAKITGIEFSRLITARRYRYENGEIEATKMYDEYCKNWFYDHRDPAYDGMEPAGFREWFDNEFQEWLDDEDQYDEE